MPFHEITGHAHPIAVLQAAVSHDRLGHAYLFHGEEAIGKLNAFLGYFSG